MIDQLDARLIELLTAEPRIGVLEASRRLGVARGTVQARIDQMQARGVITGFGPDIDPAALGHAVTAFVTVELMQSGGRDEVALRLAEIGEILEAHTITGPGDMLCRVVPLSPSRPPSVTGRRRWSAPRDRRERLPRPGGPGRGRLAADQLVRDA